MNYMFNQDYEGKSAVDATMYVRRRKKNAKQSENCSKKAQQELAKTMTRDQGSK